MFLFGPRSDRKKKTIPTTTMIAKISQNNVDAMYRTESMIKEKMSEGTDEAEDDVGISFSLVIVISFVEENISFFQCREMKMVLSIVHEKSTSI